MPTPLDSSYTTAKPRRATFSLWRVLLYMLLLLILLIALALGAFYVYLKMYPEVVSQKISQELQRTLGIEVTFSGVDVNIMPIPALSFVDVKLTQKNFTLDVAYATVTPSLGQFLRGEFSLGHISLWRPVVHGHGALPIPEASLPTIHAAPSVASASNLNATPTANATPTLNSTLLTPKAEQHISVQSVAEAMHRWQSTLETVSQHISPLLLGSSLEIKHGKVLWEFQDLLLQCENIQSSLKLGFLGALQGDVTFSSTHALLQQKPYMRMKNFAMQFSGNIYENVQATLETELSTIEVLRQGHIRLAATYTVPTQNVTEQKVATPSVPVAASVSIPASASILAPATTSVSAPVQLSWETQLQVVWEGKPLSIQSQGNLEGNLREALYFKGVRWQMEKDAAVLDATLHIKDTAAPVLQGELKVERLSLPQWFGFARALPLGLRNTLDTLQGHLHFVLDTQGLDVHKLSATAAEAHFTGRGGVKQWSKPVISLDIAGDFLQLKKVYPEIEAEDAPPLSFAHTPLLALSDATTKEEDASSVKVHYDIRIGTKKLLAWDLLAEDMSFRCSSAGVDGEKVPEKHKDAVFLHFASEKLYGGRAEGDLTLYRLPSQDMAYDIRGIVRNVEAVKPVQRLFGYKFLEGRMNVDTTFTAKGGSVSEFLLSQQGMAALRIDNGQAYSRDGKAFPFILLTLASDFTAQNLSKVQGATLPPSLQYSGQWNGSLRTKEFSTRASWNGTASLTGQDYATLVLREVPARVNVSLSPILTDFSSPINMDVDGRFSLNTQTFTASVKGAQVSIPDFGSLHLSGNASMNFAKDFSCSADIKGGAASLSELLWRMSNQSKSLVPSGFPQRLKGSTKLTYAQNTLRLDALSLQAHPMHLKGSIQRTFSAKSAWNFTLSLNSFDFDAFFGRKSTHSGLENTSHKHQASAARSWGWLRGFQAKGTFHLGNLHIKEMNISNISAPIHIENSRITCNPITASMYDGTLRLQFNGHVQGTALQSRIVMNTQDVSLFALTQDLGMQTALSGPASLSLTLEGPLLQDVLAGLHGKWNVHVGRGFMQSRNSRGNLTGKPTYISSFSDHGTLKQGVLHSQRFFLMGPDLQVTGKGQVNLLQNTLDMHLLANLDTVVDIPVRYFGSLSNPQRDLNDGAVVLATIGSLGTGIFDLLGGIFNILFGTF